MTRGRLVALLAVVGLAFGLDLAAPPERQASARLVIAGVRLYQATLSPLVARTAIRCRFEPTCSHYAIAVLERYGTLRGSRRAAGRVLRCGPWTPAGTLDPP